MDGAVAQRLGQRLVDEPVLVDQRETRKARARHGHLEVVARAGAVEHVDLPRIGEGPLENALRSQIARDDLESCVKLVGPRTQSQIALSLAHATIFVLPCTREEGGGMDNLPTVIIEAMAAGLPVVSTPLAGIPEMVENDFNGILVPEHDPEAVSAAIEYLIAHPEQARRFGDRGRAIAREKFSIEASVRSLSELFEL